MELNTILCGTSLEVLRTLPDNSVDAIVTDVPYGLGNKKITLEQLIAYLQGADLDTGGDFMGANWEIPSVLVWKEGYRVLKPGGHVLSFGGTRTWDIISMGLRAAGFENRDSIEDLYPGLAWNYGCLTPDVQVLTPSGWVFSEEVRSGIRLLGFDPKDGSFDWQPVREVHAHHHSGPMVRVELPDQGCYDVTPDHRVVMLHGGEWKIVSAQEVHAQAEVPLIEDLQGLLDTLQSARCQGSTSGDLLASMSLRTCIQGSENYEEACLGTQGESSSDLFSVRPSVLSSEMLGSEGNSSGILFEQVQRGGSRQRVGEARTQGPCCVDRGASRFASPHLARFGRVPYQGPVWCVTVPTGAFVARRGDLIFVTGNSGMPKSTNISKQIDKKAGAKRKVLGKSPYAARANKHSRAMSPGDLPRAAEDTREVTEPATAEAKLHDGKGTGLKPCWEPILVFRKPCEGTVTDNVLKYGTGALNIDACRIKHASKEDFEAHKAQVEAVRAKGGVRGNSWKNASDLSGASEVTEAGRWPTNGVLAHHPDCRKVGTKKVLSNNPGNKIESDTTKYAYGKFQTRSLVGHADEDGTETVEAWECVPGCPVAALDEQSGDRPSTLTGRADPNQVHDHPGTDKSSKSTFLGEDREHLSRVYADEGGASRFYPQFEGDDTPEGRWPPNAALTHHPDCKVVGHRKVDAPVINRFDDGAKPFGGGAGHEYTSTQTGDENGQEEIPVWECVDGCPVKELDEQSGELRAGYSGAQNKGMGYHGASSDDADGTIPSTCTKDSGGASRFYGQFQEPDAPFRYVAKPSPKEFTLEGLIENDHPTKKPLELMRWLVRLVCVKGGTVLDPYCGSGSTLHAACLEGVNYIGIDKDPHACDIATKRMDIVLGREKVRQEQMSLFDFMMELD